MCTFPSVGSFANDSYLWLDVLYTFVHANKETALWQLHLLVVAGCCLPLNVASPKVRMKYNWSKSCARFDSVMCLGDVL